MTDSFFHSSYTNRTAVAVAGLVAHHYLFPPVSERGSRVWSVCLGNGQGEAVSQAHSALNPYILNLP